MGPEEDKEVCDVCAGTGKVPVKWTERNKGFARCEVCRGKGTIQG